MKVRYVNFSGFSNARSSLMAQAQATRNRKPRLHRSLARHQSPALREGLCAGPRLLLFSPRSSELRAEAMRRSGFCLVDYPVSRHKVKLRLRSFLSQEAAISASAVPPSNQAPKRWPQFPELRVLGAAARVSADLVAAAASTTRAA